MRLIIPKNYYADIVTIIVILKFTVDVSILAMLDISSMFHMNVIIVRIFVRQVQV